MLLHTLWVLGNALAGIFICAWYSVDSDLELKRAKKRRFFLTVMRIGLDTSALDPNFKHHAGRGIGRYVTELSKRLVSRDDVYPFDYTTLAKMPLSERIISLAPYGKQTLSQQLLYPIKLHRGELRSCDVIHFPAHMDAPSWCRTPIILTVLDLIPLMFEELYSSGNADWRFRLARKLEIRSIKNAAYIFTISECVANDVHEVLGFPRDRIHVTHLGVDRKFFSSGTREPRSAELWSKYHLDQERPTLLYVGGIDQRKNIGVLLEAFASLLRETKLKPQLFLAGKIQSDKQYPALEALIHQLGVDRDVVRPGYVPDEDLLHFYRSTDLFAFPSLYEGFGLPPLEAMAAGLPVVSSDRSAMPEVLGEAALFVNPENSQDLARAIASVLESGSLAERLREKGIARAGSFTWDKTADATVDGYSRFQGVKDMPVNFSRQVRNAL